MSDDNEERAIGRLEQFVAKHTPTMRELIILYAEAKKRNLDGLPGRAGEGEQQYRAFAEVVCALEDFGRDVSEAKAVAEELRSVAGFAPWDQEPTDN